MLTFKSPCNGQPALYQHRMAFNSLLDPLRFNADVPLCGGGIEPQRIEQAIQNHAQLL